MKLETLTGLMGDALKSLAKHDLDERTVRLYGDAIVGQFKKRPDKTEDKTVALIKSMEDDEANHGGLRSARTLKLMGEVRLAVRP